MQLGEGEYRPNQVRDFSVVEIAKKKLWANPFNGFRSAQLYCCLGAAGQQEVINLRQTNLQCRQLWFEKHNFDENYDITDNALRMLLIVCLQITNLSLFRFVVIVRFHIDVSRVFSVFQHQFHIEFGMKRRDLDGNYIALQEERIKRQNCYISSFREGASLYFWECNVSQIVLPPLTHTEGPLLRLSYFFSVLNFSLIDYLRCRNKYKLLTFAPHPPDMRVPCFKSARIKSFFSTAYSVSAKVILKWSCLALRLKIYKVPFLYAFSLTKK